MSPSEHMDSSLNSQDVHTVPVSESVSIRVYKDTRPHNWKIAKLQKGLILVCNGKEKVAEGAGFGFPVLANSYETYFSGTSRVRISKSHDGWLIKKEFLMDRVARNNFRNARLQNRSARFLINQLSRLYREQPQFRLLTFKKLTKKIQIGTSYVETGPSALVTFTYRIQRKRIWINADFRDARTEEVEKIFILNEQGATFFPQYTDSDGIVLHGRKIGAWNEVNGEWASLHSSKDLTGFRLWRNDDAILRRGREYIEGSLDWTGLDYEMIPGKTSLDYMIEILEP